MRRFCSILLPVLVVGLVLLAGCDSGSTVPDDIGDNTSVGFVETSATVVEGEDGTYDLEMVADDPGHEEVRFDLSIDRQSTATLSEDVTGLTGDTTVAFPKSATSGGTLSLPLDIVDEPIDETGFLEDAETLSVTLSPADTLAPDIDEGAESFTLTIEEDDEPLTTLEARDRPTGSRAVVDGIVTRVDGDGPYVQDDEGALYTFDSDFAEQVSQGDRVRVDGSTSFFSGLFQIEAATDGPLTEVLSSDNALPSPKAVTISEINENGEEYESELIRVENFSIDDKGDDTFQAGGGAGNYTVSAGSNELTLRIPSGSELEGEEIPDQANFQGVLGQFNNFGDPDENTGYQLLGLLSSDLEVTSTTFALEADGSDLEPASGDRSTECMVRLSTGELIFFNAADGGIFVWDGSSLIEHRSASDLNNDVPDESGDFDSCDGAATESGSVYFLLRGASNDNYIYRTEAADASDNSFKKFNGANAVAAGESTVYIGAISAFGAPGDGIFEVSGDLSGSVTELATNSDVNPAVISLDDQGTLFGFSSSFGGGDLESALFTVDVTASSPSIDAYADPYRGGSPLSQTGDEITDLVPVTVDGEQFVIVYNASFDGSNGEEWGAIRRSDQSIELLVTENDLVANLPVDEYTSGTAPLAVSDDGSILAASLPDFGASNYIAKVSNVLPQ